MVDGTLDYLSSTTDCSDGSVCCGPGNTACCAAGRGHARILFRPVAPIPSASDTKALSSYYAKLDVFTFPITRSSSSILAYTSSNGTSSSTVSSFSSLLPTQSASSDSMTNQGGLSTGGKSGISPTQSASPSSMPNQGGLSTGAKAGIGVGLGLGAFLATIGIVFFLMSKHKGTARGGGREGVEIEAYTMPELDVSSVDSKRLHTAELDAVDNRHQKVTQNELEV